MNYPFIIRHSLPHRTRIRWSGDAEERGQVEALAPRIAALPGVYATDARPHTGSIVIEHDPLDRAQLETMLQTELGLEIGAGPASATGLELFNRGVGEFERELKKSGIDLNSLVFLLLLVMAVAQTARGRFGVSGFSLLWYALNVASRGRNKTPGLADETAAEAGEIRPL